ncbi:MAG: hypothetical protein KatS3mg022_3590 [Armatimonadota bacterium]|nr:MAG: hypothetical protein KatS3mg022_3590 [Armatimonadota bacterium]
MTIGIDWDRLGVIGLFLGTALALFVAFVLVTQKEVNDRLRPVRYHVQRTEAYMNDIKINVVDARKQTNEAIVLIQEAIVSRDEKKLIASSATPESNGCESPGNGEFMQIYQRRTARCKTSYQNHE